MTEAGTKARSVAFRLPGVTERVAIFGRTGSGKTVFSTWLLSHATIDSQPWILFDHKDDKYLANLPRIEEIKMGELPKYPGIYRVKARFTQDDEVDAYLHKILERGNTGVFTDEGSSIQQREPKYVGLKALFAQGRSKRTPVIFATQRPSWVNRSVLSEGDFYASFHLQHAQDRESARRFMTEHVETRLDDFHAHWYDVKRDASFILSPVNEDETFERLDERLRPRRTFL